MTAITAPPYCLRECLTTGGSRARFLASYGGAERLTQYCQRLRLYRVEAQLPSLLEQAAKRDLAYSDFLDEVLELE
jgi:hypothetical protein